jgi:hypothetical protein
LARRGRPGEYARVIAMPSSIAARHHLRLSAGTPARLPFPIFINLAVSSIS